MIFDQECMQKIIAATVHFVFEVVKQCPEKSEQEITETAITRFTRAIDKVRMEK